MSLEMMSQHVLTDYIKSYAYILLIIIKDKNGRIYLVIIYIILNYNKNLL